MIYPSQKRKSFKQNFIKAFLISPFLILYYYRYPVFTNSHFPWNIIASTALVLLSIVALLIPLTFSHALSSLFVKHETIPGGFTIKSRVTKTGAAILLTLIAGTVFIVWYSGSYYIIDKNKVYACISIIAAYTFIDVVIRRIA